MPAGQKSAWGKPTINLLQARFGPTSVSDRVAEILKARCMNRSEGWAFKSHYKSKHIGAAFVNRQWVKAGKAAGLSEDLVLYCSTHDFGYRRSSGRQLFAALFRNGSYTDDDLADGELLSQEFVRDR